MIASTVKFTNIGNATPKREESVALTLDNWDSSSSSSSSSLNSDTESVDSKTKCDDYVIDSYGRARATSYFMNEEKVVDFVLAFQNLPSTKIKQPAAGVRQTRLFAHYRQLFETELRSAGLELEYEVPDKTASSNTMLTSFVKIHAPYEFLAKEAESMRVKVPVAAVDDDLVNTVGSVKLPFLDKFRIPANARPKQQRYYKTYYDSKRPKMFLSRDRDIFFQPIDRIRMVWNRIAQLRIQIGQPTQGKGSSSRKIKLPSKSTKNDVELMGEEAIGKDLQSIHWLLNKKIYLAAYPLHDSRYLYPAHNDPFDDVPPKHLPQRYWLYRYWASWSAVRYIQPLEEIYRYFGMQCAMYFGWLGMYTKWLIVPTFLGIISMLFGIYKAQTYSHLIKFTCRTDQELVGMPVCRLCRSLMCPFNSPNKECKYSYIAVLCDNESISFFAILVCMWASLFMTMWKRRQLELAVRWGAHGQEDREELPRADYLLNVKTTRINPVTNETEVYLSSRERWRRLAASGAAVLFYIIVVVGFLAAVAAYRILSMSFYKRLGKIDQMMDSGIDLNLITTIVTSVLTTITIFLLSYVYKKAAVVLTNFERLRTDSEYEKSYCYKLFAFEFMNNYGSLFYLAIFKGRFQESLADMPETVDLCPFTGCFAQLAIQLITIFTIKQVINNVQEVGIPFLKNFRNRKSVAKQAKYEAKTLTQSAQDYLLLQEDGPAMFGDYLEMAIQYGFLVMFAAAFPLGPLFVLLNNVMEIRVDANKFTTEHRRPIPQQLRTIGPWLNIMEILTKLSVITNALIIALTSEDMNRWVFKFLYKTKEYDESFGYLLSDIVIYSTRDVYSQDEDVDALIRNDNGTVVDLCMYRGSLYSSSERKYPRSEIGFTVTIGRLTFIIVFTFIVSLFSHIINQRIPAMSERVKQYIQREQFVIKRKKANA